MVDSVRVLFVEDEEADVLLARRELERDGLHFVWHTAANEQQLRQGLVGFQPSVVLCDYTIPGFSGRAALQLTQLLAPATPVIMVSGSIGEDVGIACMREGATDYLLKSNLRRLGPAVRRAIADARERERSREMEQVSKRLAEVLEASPDVVVMSDSDGRITFANDAACRLLGTVRSEMMRWKWEAIYAPRYRDRAREVAMRTALEVGSWQGEIAIAAPDGAAIATSQVVTAHKDLNGKVRFLSTIARDLRNLKAFQEQIHQLSHYDSLTGLPNLASVKNVGRNAVRRAKRGNGTFALVIVNLDGFSLVDQGFRRALGDDVLRSVSGTLTSAVPKGSTVARVGADEFLLVLNELTNANEIETLVRKVLDTIATPRRIAGHELQITASVGIALYPAHGATVEILQRKASAAMRNAKARGHGGIEFHSGNPERHALQRLHLETSLRQTIERKELVVHYQPQFDVRTGRECGVEALARWFPRGGEPISPAVFIPLAEQTGLISSLGSFVLQNACATVSRWRLGSDPPPTLSINVSTHQVRQEFSETLARALSLSGFPADRLELEITESILIENAELALDCLAQWKRLGVRIAVDDFGTGYSSLSYLSRLPVDRLKVDKSLVHRMIDDSRSETIVRTVLSLGRELGFAVIAEGVETEAQFQRLQELGCPQVQGYLLAAPQPAAEARAMLGSRWGARGAIERRVPALRPVVENRHAG
jgi:diguanylate cyclase (GGDEF)-like protein/PAS domain S-box-containing protein